MAAEISPQTATPDEDAELIARYIEADPNRRGAYNVWIVDYCVPVWALIRYHSPRAKVWSGLDASPYRARVSQHRDRSRDLKRAVAPPGFGLAAPGRRALGSMALTYH